MESTCTNHSCEVSAAVMADADRAMAAITTLEGLRGWWTPDVDGGTSPGQTLTFRFSAIDESIRMRVEDQTSTTVVWTCLEHTSAPSWSDTAVRFEITPAVGGTQVTIRHDGITGATVERGWRYFLDSIASWATTGCGQPYVG